MVSQPIYGHLKGVTGAGLLSLHPGGRVLPHKRLMVMCRWMRSHFRDWIDYNGVAFSIELLEWGRTFSDFGVRQFFIFTVSKRTRMFVLYVKSVLHSVQGRYMIMNRQ